MTHRAGQHHAVVLIAVLIMLVGLSSTAVVAARLAATMARAEAASVHARIADELSWEARRPVLDWLATCSATVVLPPEAREPRVLILDDRLDLDGLVASVRIEATDACAPARVNISTFPIADVRDALNAKGLGGIDIIERARSEGRVPPRPSGGAVSTPEERLRIVNSSPRWRVRITVRVGDIERQWDAVYTAGEGAWMCELRELVDE